MEQEIQLNEHNKQEYPPMHTAEHLLNSQMVKYFHCERSFSAHIEKKKSKCDYHFKTAPSAEDIARLPEPGIKTVRVIRIGDYDQCACIGLHVTNTAEIGTFRIISFDFNDGVLRIRFKLGK